MDSNTKTRSGYIIGLCSLVYFVSYFARKDFAAVMAVMLSENVIDKSMGGFIGMGLFVCYGVGQLVSGYLGDKLSPSVLLGLGLAVTALCNLAMPVVKAPVLMIPIWAVNGFAQAMLWPPIVRILADNLDAKRFLTANLLVTSSAHVSTIILYIYVPICIKLFDWQTVFITASVISAVVLIVFVVSMLTVLRERDDGIKDAGQKDMQREPRFLSLFSRTGLITIFFAIIMMGFLRDGIESWLPTLYAEAFSRDAGEAVLVSAVLPLFSIISIISITAAHKTRIFNNEARGAAILFISAAVLCIPMAVFMGVDNAVLRIVCLILSALICACMHAVNFLFISCVPGRFAKYGRAATASGFSNACTYVGAAISMYGIGAVSDALGWSMTVVSWMLVAALGVVFCLLALKKFTAFIAKNDKTE